VNPPQTDGSDVVFYGKQSRSGFFLCGDSDTQYQQQTETARVM